MWMIYVLIIVIIICLILMIYTTIYNQYQNCIIRINAAEGAIDSNLRKKFDLLNRSINIIKANTKLENDNILEDIVRLRSRKLSNFDFDRNLEGCLNEFYHIMGQHPELTQSAELVKIVKSLNEIEEKLMGARDYYNHKITKYNFLIRSFPTNIIGFISKYKERPFFDGKDMNDEIYNDFKI